MVAGDVVSMGNVTVVERRSCSLCRRGRGSVQAVTTEQPHCVVVNNDSGDSGDDGEADDNSTPTSTSCRLLQTIVACRFILTFYKLVRPRQGSGFSEGKRKSSGHGGKSSKPEQNERLREIWKI